MSWTQLIDSLVATKAELQALVFTRGVHLEINMAATHLERKDGTVALLASTDPDEHNPTI